MKFTVIFAVLALTAGFVFVACQDKSANPPPAQNNNTTPSNPDSFLLLQMTPGDSIDSSGTYYVSNDTTCWVMEDTAGNLDTVGVVIHVSGNTGRVTGVSFPGVTNTLDIKGVLACGPGGTFEGSVWSAESVSTVYNGLPLSTGLA